MDPSSLTGQNTAAPTVPNGMRPVGVPTGLQPATTPTGMPPGTVIFPDQGEVSFDHTIKVKTPASGAMFFNRYRLDRVLGRGGMGVVWLADDLKLERPVALKFLPSLLGLDAAAVKELKTETRRGLELSHPNIVRIYDFVDDEELAAISMEFVDGRTLSELRMGTPHGVFSVQQVVQWLPGVCAALDYAHFHRKVVHRDLKPANIMSTTKDHVAKIADFGIARSLSDTMSRLSAANLSTSGTLPYMSPQQAMGERPMPTDDVYSLGATIYELLSGKPPFYRGDISTQITSKIPSSMLERRTELEIKASDAIPKEWENAIAQCLHKDANMRPQSAGALAEMLGLSSSLSSGVTKTFVNKPASASSAGKPRSKAPLLAAAAVVAAGAAAAYHFGLFPPQPKPLAAASPASPAKAAATEVPAPVKTEETPAKADTSPATTGPKAPATPVVSETPPATGTATTTPAPTVAAATPPAPANAAPAAANTTPAPPSAPVSAPGTVASAPPSPAAASQAGMSLDPNTAPPPATVATPAVTTPPPAAPPGPGVFVPPPGMVVTPYKPGAMLPPGTAMQPGMAAAPVQPWMVQPPVTEPPNGHWPLALIFPTPPQAAFSESGRRRLLYEVQGVLRDKNLYNSTQDGKEGKGTHTAIVLFQAKSGLVPNGMLDGPTLMAMGLLGQADDPQWIPPGTYDSGASGTGGRRRGPMPEPEQSFFERAGGKIGRFFNKR